MYAELIEWAEKVKIEQIKELPESLDILIQEAWDNEDVEDETAELMRSKSKKVSEGRRKAITSYLRHNYTNYESLKEKCYFYPIAYRTVRRRCNNFATQLFRRLSNKEK